jgi:hypothetical protein
MLSQWFVHTALPPKHRSWMITQRSHVPDRLTLYPNSSSSILRIFGSIQSTHKGTAMFSGFARALSELDDMCRHELDRFSRLFLALDSRSAKPLDIIPEPRELQSNNRFIPQGSLRKMFEQEAEFGSKTDLQAFLLGDSSSPSGSYFHCTYAVILASDLESGMWRRIGLVWWQTLHCAIKPDYHMFLPFEAEVH